jgi:sodium/hydrogen exchanger-like protein 6/7/sodium/hydrogen exchanger 8
MYITIGSFMEKAHFPVGHETGVMILFGIGASYIIRFFAHKNCHNLEDIVVLNWSNNIFFCVLLPLIVFATGFNIRRRKFFQNIKNIAKFGLLGTLLTFLFYSLLTIAAFEIFDFAM